MLFGGFDTKCVILNGFDLASNQSVIIKMDFVDTPKRQASGLTRTPIATQSKVEKVK